MKFVDARSGEVMRIGDTVRYASGESLQLVDAKVGFLSAEVLLKWRGNYDPVESMAWTPAPVRYLHPRFPMQKVVFVPS